MRNPENWSLVLLRLAVWVTFNLILLWSASGLRMPCNVIGPTCHITSCYKSFAGKKMLWSIIGDKMLYLCMRGHKCHAGMHVKTLFLWGRLLVFRAFWQALLPKSAVLHHCWYQWKIMNTQTWWLSFCKCLFAQKWHGVAQSIQGRNFSMWDYELLPQTRPGSEWPSVKMCLGQVAVLGYLQGKLISLLNRSDWDIILHPRSF